MAYSNLRRIWICATSSWKVFLRFCKCSKCLMSKRHKKPLRYILVLLSCGATCQNCICFFLTKSPTYLFCSELLFFMLFMLYFFHVIFRICLMFASFFSFFLFFCISGHGEILNYNGLRQIGLISLNWDLKSFPLWGSFVFV